MSGLHKNANQTATPEEANKAVAFVNWALPKRDGSFIKASKGFAIFQNPRYPNRHEDMLVDLARANGGRIEVMMKCTISINNAQDLGEIKLDDIDLIQPIASTAVPAAN